MKVKSSDGCGSKMAYTAGLLTALILSVVLFPLTASADGADLAEGYYRIMSAGNGIGYSGGPYNYEGRVAWYNEDGLVRWAIYDANDYSMVYELKRQGDGWLLLNMRDGTYVNKGTASYGGNVTTSKTPALQTITAAGDGKYMIQPAESRFIYSMTRSHNGSMDEYSTLSIWGTPAEGVKYGVNLWYFTPVSTEVVDYLRDNDVQGTVSISYTDEAPQAGKKYVIKNATEDFYITSSGGMTPTAEVENEYFWQLEETGSSVDGYATFVLKSVGEGAYWQAVDFAAKRWDDGNPYDGYDWYDYAGMNAEFGDRSSAMEVTVLAAGSTGDWRSQGATSGYVLAMKDVVTTTKTFYYKLGHQDNNVGMEPWNEGVGWLFYPVTDTNDQMEELQNALSTYGNLSTELPIGDDPGFYSAERIEAYRLALQEAQAITGKETKNKIRSVIQNLTDAANDMQQPNPIEEGYYYIVTAGNGCGYYTGSTPPDVNYNFEWQKAMYNDGEYVRWRDFDVNDFEEIYQFYQDGDNSWFVKSALNGTYIDKGEKTYATRICTNADRQTSQTFELLGDGKFTIKPSGNPYVYSMAATHNGSSAAEGSLNIWGSTAEASKFGVNVWYVKTVSESVMEQFSKTNVGLIALCTQYELATRNLPTDDAPGYYYAQNIEALNAVIASVREQAKGDLTDEQKAQLRQQLSDAYDTAMEVKPVDDGYYYIVNNYEDYKETFGNYPAIYTTSLSTGGNTTACYYETFNPDNANYIYYIAKQDNDTFSVQNAYTKRYLNTGEASGKAGEIFTSSDHIVNNQVLRWKQVGSYWMTDQTSLTVGHAIANAASLNKRLFVVGATAYDDKIPAAIAGYNTWSLLPIAADKAQQLIAAQQAADLAANQAYSQMKSFAEEIDDKYNEIISDEDNKYNTDAVIMLKSKRNNVQSFINAKPYDITTTAADYSAAETELRTAYQNALTAKPDSIGNQQLSGTPIGATSVDYSTSQPSTTVNTPAEAFDNDYTTYYAAYERSTGWVGLDLGKPFIIERVAYAPRAGWGNRMQLGLFEGANKEDFSDAIPFYVIRDAAPEETLTTDTVICSRGFRYVRYVGPNDARSNISELRFYGKPGRGDDSQLFQLTNLPLVVIRTQANVADVTSKTTWLPGWVNIISDQGTALKYDSMTVRGRGNGSWTFPKKPYKLKLANKSRLLNMPAKAKEWTLINNYGDKTMIRNNVAFKLSEIFEMDYTPAATLVDVIFNGQYKGSYQLCDQVEVRKNRVDITEMTPEDNEGEALTGGYLIELDAYAGGEPKHFSSSPYNIPVTVHYPKHDEITAEQYDYIQSAFNDLCARVNSDQFKSDSQGYAAVLAEDTWLKYFLIAELSGNTDSYWSVYLTKDRNDKFRVCPVWDFDLAFDNDRRTHPILTMTTYLSLSSKSSAATGVRNFNRKIVESCSEELKELWSLYRYNHNLNADYLHEVIDSLGEENSISQEWNYTRWDILNTPTQQQYTTRGSYQAEVNYIYEYLSDRIAWMDNIVGLEEPIGIHDAVPTEAHGGIHGFDGTLSVRGFAVGSTVSAYTAGGTLAATAVTNDFEIRLTLQPGIYIVRVKQPDGTTATRKVAIR